MTNPSLATGVRPVLVQRLCLMLLVAAAAFGTARAQSFSLPIQRNVGFNPYAVAVGDFNNDGKPDAAVANSLAGSVTIALGNGDGTFASSIEYNTDLNASGVVVGDFNKDGKLDAAVSNFRGGPTNDGNISVLFGNGDGQAQAAVNYNAGSPEGLYAADLNSDGNLDLITASTSTDKATVLLGNANGTFNAAVGYTVGTHPTGVAVADYNNDTKLDMVTANLDGSGLSVLLGNGDGTFQAATNLPTTSPLSRPLSITAGDLNGDGKADLVVASPNDHTVGVLPGNGNGTFQPPNNYTTSGETYYPRLADFNGDGKLDVAAVNATGTASVAILRGNGDGTLQSAFNVPTQSNPWGLVATDFNLDGKPDLITTNQVINRVNVLLNSPSARGANFNATVALQASGVLVATFIDYDTTKTAASFTATINWGDGTAPVAGTVAANGSGGFDVTGTHTYAAGGVFTVGVQIADANQNFASASGTATVAKADQTITFAQPADKTFGDPDFDLSASASSGLAVSFSAAGNCSLVSATTVRITGAGSCTVTASQPGDASYNAAPNVVRSFSIAKANQLITFNAIQDKIFGAPDFRVFAQTNSALTPTFTTVGQCVLVSGNTFHITGAGSCTITAHQAGNVNWNPAPDVSRSFQIAKSGTLTAVSSSANPAAFGQSVTFTATVVATTSGAGTPNGTVQFEIDGANVGGPVALDSNGAATFTTSSLSAGAHAVTARYGGAANFEASAGSLAAGQQVGSFFQFSQSSYSVNEGASLVVTVRRTGDTSQAETVDYATDDGSTPSVVVPCSSVTGIALDRCDYTKTIGTLSFAAGETEKTFVVLGGDDSYVEGPEAAGLKLSNPSAGASLVLNSTASFTINDDSPESSGNPSDDDEKFVTQHYRDFLNRDPDADGLAFWKGQITSCGSNQACRDVRRINVSAAFFLSIEFQETGYLVERAYKVAYGDATSPNVAGTVPVIRLEEFLPDTQRISQGVMVGVGAWQQVLETNKRNYFMAFTTRARFENAYPLTLSPAQFVDRLFQNAGVTPTTAERNAAVAEFGTSSNTGDQLARARALRRVAEHPALAEAEKNRAFVLMEYYGYLRRNPDNAPEPTLNFGGWKFWLTKLEQFNGNFVNAEMVKAFISSDEYRHRFGQ